MSEEQKVQEELQEQLDTETLVDAADATATDSADDQTAALVAAEQEVVNLKEQVLRVQAEMQNVRRRAELDVEKAHKFGVEKFANEMLATVDNLERALAAAVADDESTRALREGVEMTLSGLVAGLEKFKVESVDPVGSAFNPEFHQAMAMVENPDAAPNTVIAVMQKGYTLQGRLLRPAMVVVSKGAPQIDENA
ncbi:MAG: nucleotide exchange factor GrpE [Thalassobium sp.]|jgi:molecular chaperone GrpE|uniref:Protein GrpE n=1 Tax=Thalassolituus pacificus TaxID=2975440 RepID=A0A9X2WDD8_9GAMM|nr:MULTISPECIES: nucleotide exchange factor GrpE [Thalassolituus]MCT7358045.1 nucleotide exchange factor GrpE [Thalassolituus pacificus]PHS63542.1 MAG: nucleotide exchange factor GrpE [Thalassobium sp.]